MKISTEGTYTIVRPIYQVFARDQRVDRTALSKVFKTIVKKKDLTLDDVASYAIDAPTVTSYNGLDQILASLFDASLTKRSLSRLLRDEEGDLLRFYGAMTSTQKKNLAAGGAVPISGLSPFQIKILKKMVFCNDYGPDFHAADQAVNHGGNGQDRMRLRSDIERTDVLYTGIPASTVLTMKTETDPGVIGLEDYDSEYRHRLMNEEEFAHNILFVRYRLSPSGRRNGRSVYSSSQKYNKYLVASRINMTFCFAVSPRATLVRTTQEERVISNTPVSFEQLPSDFRARVLSIVEKERTEILNRQKEENRAEQISH